MKYLEEIIGSLEEEDQREFQAFIQRNKQKKDRKDLKLFELLSERQLSTGEIIAQLALPNANAYHSLRKRLYRHLSDFVLLKSMDQEVTASGSVNALYTMARYLFQKGLNEAAWKLLIRAEKFGLQNELFDLLKTIYLLQIEYCHLNDQVVLEEVIQRYEDNNIKLQQTEKILLLQAVLKKRVLDSKRQGIEVSFEDIFAETLTDFKMKRLSRESPKILYALMSTLRQWVIISKEFHAFEPTLERSYHALVNRDHPYYLVQLLMMLAHTKYRTKRFAESMDYLAEAEALLTSTPAHYQKSTRPRITQLRAANLIFLDGLDEAIALLESLLQQKVSDKIKSNVITNLGIFCFYKQDYKRCLRLLNSYEHTETWYKNHMGREWLMKRDLMVVLLHNDSGDKDLAEARIRSIERKYTELFQQKRYRRAALFLSLIKRIVYNEGAMDLKEIEQKVPVAWDWVPRKEEDLQAMLFSAWLRSKVTPASFYECIVELINTTPRAA